MPITIQAKAHYRRIRRILVWVLFLNWLVAAAKIFYGTFSRSGSMTADGFHSISDGASNIIALAGIYFSCRPKDKDHPYGHKKYETFFALGIAFLLFMAAFNLTREGLARLKHPVSPRIGAASFIVMLATMAINFLVMRYESRRGRELKSDILSCDAMHTRADLLTSFSVLAALLAAKIGQPLVDPLATIFISLVITWGGIEIVRESSVVLCDTAAILDSEKLEGVVLSVKGVKACHKIRTRGRPDDIYLDLHVQVAPNMHIDAAHRVSYAIEEAIKKEIPGVSDVVVHMEPQE